MKPMPMHNACEIVETRGGKWYGDYGVCRCPVHEDKTPSLSVTERGGKVLVNCHAGCDGRDVLAALRQQGVSTTSNFQVTSSPSKTDADRTEAAQRIWRTCRPATGTLVQDYLKFRGITLDPPRSIRYHAALRHSPTGLDLPAMVARA